jgi:hypothetical protein
LPSPPQPAFTAENLNETLNMLARDFINRNDNALIISDGGKKVEVSKIFDWYKDDFTGGVVAYMNTFRDEPLDAHASVSYQTYHWTLNQSE